MMSTDKNESDLAERIRVLLEGLRPGDRDSIEKLRDVYDADVSFEDPTQRVRGVDAFIALNHRLFDRAKELFLRSKAQRARARKCF
jgi:hypothetical protein